MRLAKCLPPESATARAVTGEHYSLQDILAAMTVDALMVANWQRASQGKKKSERDKPPESITNILLGPAETTPSEGTITTAQLLKAEAEDLERRANLG